jgi:hypothetical protein
MARRRQRVRLQDGLKLDLNSLVGKARCTLARNAALPFAGHIAIRTMKSRQDGLRRTRRMGVADGFALSLATWISGSN